MAACTHVQLGWETADHLAVGVPAQTYDQVLVMWLLCHSSCSLVAGLEKQGAFNLPPSVLQGEFIFQKQCGCFSCPSVYAGYLPVPLQHVGYGGSHGALDCVLWVLLFLELGVDCCPSLLKMLVLILRPCV